ncbi:hypothetical protein CMI37_01135 [Candidatus Pacearchaeota archaeon]|nr:hypothetical protein [Candidatus Pacearchaeota archaeon]
MATETYVPDSTDGVGWDGYDAARPPTTLAMDTEDALSGAELTTISTSDDSRVSRVDSIPGHHLRFKITQTEADVTQLDLKFEGYGLAMGGGTPFYGCWIWNFDSTTWEAGSNHGGSSDADVTKQITANLPNYIDGSGYVHGLAMGSLDGAANDSVYTDYAELIVTYTEASSADIFFGANL